MRAAGKALLPLAVVVVGGLLAWAMIRARAEPTTRLPEPVLPLIRTETVRLQELRLTVTSQGTVEPRSASELVAEVAGRVIGIAPSFESGGFFEQGEVLIRLDAADYRQAIVAARARVAEAERRLAWERTEAELAAREWRELGEGQPATPLTLRQPQLNEAEAALDAAHAALERGQRDVERTEIRAPYAGRVRDKQVDVGTYVVPGRTLGAIYAVDLAEIRLPLPDDELAYLDLPLAASRRTDSRVGPAVLLRARFAGEWHEWRGRIVRTEGEIDTRTRMIHAIASVDDPYGRRAKAPGTPLAVGLFVEAEIEGRLVQDVALLPRSALRSASTVLVVDADDRLRAREVGVLRSTANEVLIRSGLAAGERVCVSPLAVFSDGMRVRTAPPPGA